MADQVTHARAKLAALYAYGRTPDPETEALARRTLTAAKLERAIREAIEAAPPITTEQRTALAAILGGAAR